MNVRIPDDWPQWPADGLEYLGRCPACESQSRTALYENLIDRLFHAPGRWVMYSCNNCGSGYLDPRPNKATIARAYDDYLTHNSGNSTARNDGRLAARLRNGYLNDKYGYQMQPASQWGHLVMHLLPPLLRLEWDHYARHLPKSKPGKNKLLDVGCGNGEFLSRAKWQGWDAYGIDFDEQALSHAIESGISVTHGAVEPEKFKPGSFDAITSNQVIEHMHEPIEFLKTLYFWLKPGGIVWLGTPNMDSDSHRHFGSDWYCLHPPQHLFIFSAKSLVRSMQTTGFTNVRLAPRGYMESHIYKASKKMRESREVGSLPFFNDVSDVRLGISRQIILETLMWLRPERGSDLVVMGRKA